MERDPWAVACPRGWKWGGNAGQNPELRAPGPIRPLRGAGLGHPPRHLLGGDLQASSFSTQKSISPRPLRVSRYLLKPVLGISAQAADSLQNPLTGPRRVGRQRRLADFWLQTG